MWTTLPTLLITLVISLFMGSSAQGSDGGCILLIQDMMRAEFSISFWAFIPPLIILVMAFFKVPAILGIVGGILGGIVLSLANGSSFHDALMVLFSGYEPAHLGQFLTALRVFGLLPKHDLFVLGVCPSTLFTFI